MRKNILAAAGFLLLLISCSGGPGGTDKRNGIPGEETSEPRKRKTAASSRKSAQFPELSLDFLFEKKSRESDELPRNIISVEDDPKVVAERKKREEEARKAAEIAAKKSEEARKKAEEELVKNPPPPQPPAINFEFIGYMGPAGDHIGVFRLGSGKDSLVLKRKGDRIGEEFKIIEVGYETAEIGFEGFDETRTIPLFSGGR